MKLLPLSVMIASSTLFLYGCSTFKTSDTNHSNTADITPVAEIGVVPQRTALEQAWSEETRWNFWFTSQGARIIPYTWFTWLEQANSTELFRSAKHMEELRYLPMTTSAQNPAGLPIGFALDTDKKTGEAWMGMTCAACHTTQIDYKNTKMLIEGAPTMGNFVLFYSRLVDALNATNLESDKFERFARKVLADKYTPATAQALRTKLEQTALAAAERRVVNDLPADYPKDFTSYARLDAFGNIQNAGSAFALHDLTNNNYPSAPVSYPFLWGTHQSDVVQWNASAPNTPVVGPLVRNIGEVVGVFGGLEIKEANFWQQLLWNKHISYSSTVDMIALGKLETMVRDLRSPAWPEQYLPGIDTEKAALGAQLYQQECAQCHQVIPREKEGKKYISVKNSVVELGTDPETAWNAEHHMAKSLILEGEKTKILVGDKFPPTTQAISIPVNGVVGVVLKDPATALKAGMLPLKGEKSHKASSLKALMHEHVQARKQIQATKNAPAQDPEIAPDGRDMTGLVYKARPLNGIWATAPFLHNGSVANLWELLLKPEERSTSFWVGSRELDPVKVGFDTSKGLSLFKVMDDKGQVRPGNSNRGHDFGSNLNDNQKWALVEFMKTL